MPTLTEQTRKVAQQYRQYWLRGDLAGILSILSADAEYIIFSGATQVLIKDVVNYISLGLPSNQLRYIYHDDARVDGDMAFSLYSFVYQSSHTGKQSSARGCDVMTISDGQIVCVHEYSSFAEVGKEGPWRGLEDVERATLTWVEWFNNRRLLRSIGDVPPAEFEMT